MAIPNYIQKIMGDTRNTVYITSESGGLGIQGFIDTELSFGATAQFGALSDSAALKAASSLVKQGGAVGMGGHTLDFPWMTRQSWQSSAVNAMSFSIYLVAMNKGEDLIQKATPMYEMLLPTVGDIGSYKPPMDYQVTSDGTKNHLVVTIGEWFDSDGWLMTSGSFTVSKEKIDDAGKLPLYIKMDVTLLPAQQFDYVDATLWF